jgi:hypothetical protein
VCFIRPAAQLGKRKRHVAIVHMLLVTRVQGRMPLTALTATHVPCASLRHEEARAAFCRSYIATGTEAAAAHLQQFLQDGVGALSRPEGPNLLSAEQYFSMAVRIARTCVC